MTDVHGKGFAVYDPAARPQQQTPSTMQVRGLVPADVPVCAALIASRAGGDPDASAGRLRRDLADPDRHQFVAVVECAVVGYGAVIHYQRLPEADPGAAPAGYYLVGLMIDPPQRRRGIGDLLTTTRMSWVGQRADEVWCFANVANTAVLDMQRGLGFEEVTRDFTFPGAPLAPGTGVLLRASLR